MVSREEGLEDIEYGGAGSGVYVARYGGNEETNNILHLTRFEVGCRGGGGMSEGASGSREARGREELTLLSQRKEFLL